MYVTIKGVVHISCKTVILLNCLAKCKTKRVEDILNKKIKMIIGLLICSSLLGACSVNHKSNSNESSVKTVQVNKKVKSKNTIQKNSNSNAPHKVETVSNKLNHKMNLAQIRKGNYSSIAGEWKEVAFANNRYDGKGITWRNMNKVYIQNLRVTKNKMFLGKYELVRGKRLSDANDVKKFKRKLKFTVPSKDNRTKYPPLTASSEGAITWSLDFYPRNIPIVSQVHGRFTKAVDTRKERITIFCSNMGNNFIFQRDN